MTTRRPDHVDAILGEVATVFDRLRDGLVHDLAAEISAARRILVHSAGRTGLVMRALAMRLHHLGLQGHVAGDMTTPPIGAGDLLIVNASTGDLPSGIALLRAAARAGARTVVITAAHGGEALALADRVFRIPAQTILDDQDGHRASILPMGSQYELCLFVLTELVVLELSRQLGVSFLEMRARHANIQ
ncbi:MAG: SIS domain-containing protein [Alphaproteobacteria bacterium]|nr:SIS domain-containing protein [Alphaproteobacteria bacterium]